MEMKNQMKNLTSYLLKYLTVIMMACLIFSVSRLMDIVDNGGRIEIGWVVIRVALSLLCLIAPVCVARATRKTLRKEYRFSFTTGDWIYICSIGALLNALTVVWAGERYFSLLAMATMFLLEYVSMYFSSLKERDVDEIVSRNHEAWDRQASERINQNTEDITRQYDALIEEEILERLRQRLNRVDIGGTMEAVSEMKERLLGCRGGEVFVSYVWDYNDKQTVGERKGFEIPQDEDGFEVAVEKIKVFVISVMAYADKLDIMVGDESGSLDEGRGLILFWKRPLEGAYDVSNG